MKCEDSVEWFAVYRDLPEGGPERHMVDAHIRECPACAEEFRMWEESAELIRELPADDAIAADGFATAEINRQVMERIYADDGWFMPAVRRSYAFSRGFRRKVAGLLAGLLAIFVLGFAYTAYERLHGDAGESAGVLETASAFGATHRAGNAMYVDVPVASLSDPIFLQVSPTMPEYWIAFSMLGIIMTLLILNWFSRVRQ